MIGEIGFRPVSGSLIHNTGGMLTNMSPYVKFMVNNRTQGSQPSRGKDPAWDCPHVWFSFQGEHGIQVQVWDHDTMSSDDVIGEGFIPAGE